MHSRRNLLLGSSAVLALAGCGLVTGNTVNGVTTYTVDVGRLDKLVQAVVSAVAQFASLPFVPVTAKATFDLVSGIITTDIAAFDKAAGGALLVTLDTTSTKTIFHSVVSDAQTIMATVAASLPQTALTGTALQLVSSVKTLVLLIEAMVPSIAPVEATRATIGPIGAVPTMPEAHALAAATS